MTFNDATLLVFEPVSAETNFTGDTWVNCLILIKTHDANETPKMREFIQKQFTKDGQQSIT